MSGVGEKKRELTIDMSDLTTDVGRISDDARIAALRARVMETKDNERVSRLRDTCVIDACSLRASEIEPSWSARRGLVTRDRLSCMRFEIDDLSFWWDGSALSRPMPENRLRHAFSWKHMIWICPGRPVIVNSIWDR